MAELLKPPFNDKKTIDLQELLEVMVSTITNLEGAMIAVEVQMKALIHRVEVIEKGAKIYK